jgi:hypothetical protein
LRIKVVATPPWFADALVKEIQAVSPVISPIDLDRRTPAAVLIWLLYKFVEEKKDFSWRAPIVSSIQHVRRFSIGK